MWNSKLMKFIYENSPFVVIFLVFLLMIFIPPPIFLKKTKGVVEDVFKGKVVVPRGKKTDLRVDGTYIKLRFSDKLYNVIYEKYEKKIDNSNLVGKDVTIWYSSYKRDNDIRVIKKGNKYVIEYDWTRESIKMVLVLLCILWFILAIAYRIKRTKKVVKIN